MPTPRRFRSLLSDAPRALPPVSFRCRHTGPSATWRSRRVKLAAGILGALLAALVWAAVVVAHATPSEVP